MDFDDMCRGNRRTFILRTFSPHGRYPDVRFRAQNALYYATDSFVCSVVEAEAPNDVGFSEIAWNDVHEIRLWGALALSIKEGNGFYVFIPEYELREIHGRTLYLSQLREDVVDRVVSHMRATAPSREYNLHGVKPSESDVASLYSALATADAAILRGVNCFLKSLLLWNIPGGYFLSEEIAFNLYIALEAGLSTLRRRLSAAAGRTVSYANVFEFVAASFTAGEALAEYWQDAHDDRNALLHPDNDFSPYVIQPMSADDVWELFDPMLSIYRYILLDEPRPSIEEITGEADKRRVRQKARMGMNN